MEHINSGFAHGDFAEIQRKSQAILKKMGVENWKISHTVASYHAKRCFDSVSTPIGRVVREVARRTLKDKEKEDKKVAAMAS